MNRTAYQAITRRYRTLRSQRSRYYQHALRWRLDRRDDSYEQAAMRRLDARLGRLERRWPWLAQIKHRSGDQIGREHKARRQSLLHALEVRRASYGRLDQIGPNGHDKARQALLVRAYKANQELRALLVKAHYSAWLAGARCELRVAEARAFHRRAA